MFNVRTIQRRPNRDVPFFFQVSIFSTEYNRYSEEFLRDKMISSSREFSADRLTVALTSKWVNRNAFLEYMGDLMCYQNQRLPSYEYNIKNNIEIVSTDTFMD